MAHFEFKNLDLPALHRHVIGFDRVFDEIDRIFANNRNSGTYPPYNIIQINNTIVLLEIAVAGFSESELSVELTDHILTVSGKKPEGSAEPNYLHQGISRRNWERTFALGPNHEVLSVVVKLGILSIAIEHVIPEAEKPRKIPINYMS